MKNILMLSALTLFSLPSLGESIAVVGGKVFTMSSQGTIENATVLINDGLIESVTSNGATPEGYTIIDARGKVVTPGFVGAFTSLGLVEVSSSAGVVDASVETSQVSNTGAALDVSYGVNPDSSLINITRLEGMTSAATTITNSKYLFGGLGAVISLNGQSPILKQSAFMTVNVGSQGAELSGGTRASLWVLLERVLEEAAKAGSDTSPEKPWYGINSRSDVDVIKRVQSGEVPLFMSADSAADIRQVIAFKERHPSIKVVLVHAVEAWREADALASADIPVIIDPEYNLPGGFEQMGATLANGARLEAAGVDVAIGMDTHNIRLAAQHAGNAVANGMTHEAGIASLTSVPAKILGMEGKLGVLTEGARGDLVVWSGDPLEVTEAAEVVIIDGKPIKMESRQTKLRDRYLSLQAGDKKTPSHYFRE
ncbi:amidohydrolase family protein [Alteromonas sp. 1_MG-2023]|uniref:amidohydrolase family protein n=1 Tax=Alteromonas sp. 1_MG-2023 TaxID=3062669 RepID=UPI0026E43447|nr:amidohydrolase family protein [Alteromonas sp. 1_MG-2023]MDO6569252.1 amidohydrolase family protein [Alteromonas sp. 1_MG-2023]